MMCLTVSILLFICHIRGRTQAEGVQVQDSEEDIWA